MADQVEIFEATLVSFKRSESIGKLVDALCKAQLAFDPIKKESENPAFRRGNKVSKYADLHSLVSATRQHLNNNGLAIMQFPTVAGKNLVVTTLMAHTSNEWVSHELIIPAVDERGFTAHSIGKAMTYARRFSWQSVTGAVAEDDDDGNEASGVGSKDAAQEVAKRKLEEGAKSPDPKIRKIAEDGLAKMNSAKPVKAASVLFYTFPESHNGHFAEFVNLKEFGAGIDQVAQEGLRRVFTKYSSKITKDETALVASEKLDALLEVLAGDAGITVKKLEAHG